MLSERTHTQLGTLSVGEVQRWAFAKREYQEAVANEEFCQAVKRAYENIVKMAQKSQYSLYYSEDMKSQTTFMLAVQQRIARKLAEEYAKACIREQTWNDVAIRTVLSGEWLQSVIDYERKIVWQTFQVKHYEEIREKRSYGGVSRNDDPDDCKMD